MRFQGFTEASNLVNFWICGDSQSRGTSSHACSCQHEWVVYSLALAEGWLMLQCVECGLMGTVENPSKEEWSQGFNAPSTPYRWLDEARVVHKQPAPFRVIRALDSPACPCPRQTMLPEIKGYERIPGGIWRHTLVLSDKVKGELLDLADFVGRSELCSHFLPHFIRSCEADSGIRHSSTMHVIINLIAAFDQKGLHCSPAVVAMIIREFAEYRPT